MTKPEQKLTDSFSAYQECLKAIRRFLSVVRIENGEAWIQNVCFGSPNRPFVRAPLGHDSAALVGAAVGLAGALVESVHGTLVRAIEASFQTMEELRRQGDVDPNDFGPLMARVHTLERLVEELTQRRELLPHHPERLLRWCDILGRSLGEGDGTVQVRVVVTYVL